MGLARGRAARAHARWCTSRRASTASRARSTRPSAACCRPRRRSSSASPAPSTPSRAPEGKSVIWIQLQELPRRPTGDALGEIDVGDGTWTETLREAYADRIVERLGTQITNLASATLKRVVLSPADLEGLNRNLVGGDIYAGSCALDQNLLWRPTGQLPGHATPRRRASGRSAPRRTPGPGLGAGSGYLVAKQLLKPAAAAAGVRARHGRRGKLRARLPL